MAKKKRKHKKRLKKSVKIFMALIITVAVISAALFSVIKFVPQINFMLINNISVEENEIYSNETIIAASKLTTGNSVLKVSLHNAEKRVVESLPYAKDADISYSFNGTVTIKVTNSVATKQIKYGNYYYKLNDEGRVLDSLKVRDVGVTALVGINNEEPVVGKTAKIENDAKYELINKIYNCGKENGIIFSVIDVSNETEITAIFEERLVVSFGTVSNIESKMKFFKTMLSEMTGEDEGRILLDYWTEDNRKASHISENINETLEKY